MLYPSKEHRRDTSVGTEPVPLTDCSSLNRLLMRYYPASRDYLDDVRLLRLLACRMRHMVPEKIIACALCGTWQASSMAW